MSNARQSLWKPVVIGMLVASALAAAYVGFQSAGGSGRAQGPAQPAKNGRHDGKRFPGGPGSPGAEGAEDESKIGEPEGESEFHKRLKKFFGGGDEDALNGLLPIGVGKVEGEGGKGLGRMVKSGGKWYPVFDLSQAGGTMEEVAENQGRVALTKIRLAIASPNPPRGLVGQPYAFRFEAIGGTPPYQWSMQAGQGGGTFSLDPASGMLTGSSVAPATVPLNVFVTDAAGGQASTAYTLVIVPETPLAITTTDLPQASVGQAYQATLTAEGGVAPYEWSISASSATWQCDPMSGLLTGMPAEAEEVSVLVMLTDHQHTTVQKTFNLVVSTGLDIVTDSPLTPATPGNLYTLSFEASGGTAPYTWKVVAGSLPEGWNFSTDGLLTGQASQQEGLYQFTVEVTDNGGQTFRKPMELAVIEALIVRPSRQRAGLAWQPQNLAKSVGAPIQAVSIQRNGPGGAVEVYRGAGQTNMVDHNLVTGATYEYTLTVYTVDGRKVPFGTSKVQILPILPPASFQRGMPGATGDAFADRVVAYQPLSPTAFGAAGVPLNVTGPPDGRNVLTPASLPTEVASLGAREGTLGGYITLEFTDNIVELGPGADFTVFENVFFVGNNPDRRYMEPALVEVALFDGQWYRFPVNVNPPVKGDPDLSQPTYYAQGFAGVNPTTGSDPSNPSQSGGDSFDADALGIPGLSWIRYVRIHSTGNKAMRDLNGVVVLHTSVNGALSGVTSSGFDLDAVCAVNY